MWYEKKKEQELDRRAWVSEHSRLLEDEIKRYKESRKSEKVQQSYTSWMENKKAASVRLPSHSEARARPLSCYHEDTIHDYHKKRLSQKAQERVPVIHPPKISPRVQFERIKKIQELRQSLTSREMNRSYVSRDRPHTTRDISRSSSTVDRSRDVTRDRSRDVTRRRCATAPVSGRSAGTKPDPRSRTFDFVEGGSPYQISYRIAKLAEPKPPPKLRKRRKRRPDPEPKLGEFPDRHFRIEVDNYFKVSPAESTTPDSGFVDGALSPYLQEDTLDTKLEVLSINSVESIRQEEEEEETGMMSPRVEVSSPTKSVRFNASVDSVFFDTENDFELSGNTPDKPLRSCIKGRILSP